MEAGDILPVSAGPSGVVGTGEDPSPSLTGRFVAFDSDFNSDTTNIYIKDLVTDGLTKISGAADGSAANGNSSLPSLSANGQVVAFTSDATNLATGSFGYGQTSIYVAALTR